MTERSISAAMPCESKFVDVEGARIHYVEEGTGDPILFLHGNPTSCYLWRNVMPHLASDARCLAMDLVGMGRSDKPALDYRLVDHARYVDKFIASLGLERLTLVLHDWGSALGFHYARRHEANVRGIAFMEAIVRRAGRSGAGRTRSRSTGSRRTSPPSSASTRPGSAPPPCRSCCCTRSRGPFCARISWPGAGNT